MNYTNNIKVLRQILHELRKSSSQTSLKENLVIPYVFEQYRKFKITDEQACKAREELNFIANTYLCYLRSTRKHQEIYNQYHGKGERSIKETADIVGFKLPNDPK